MKKTMLAILLCGVLMLGLTGCGSQETSNIVTIGNEKENLTYKELSKIYKDNSIGFKEKYIGSTIVVNGKIKSIKDNETITLNYGYNTDGTIYEMSDNSWKLPMIELEDGWKIFIFSEPRYEANDSNVKIADLKVGDKIKVESHIISVKESVVNEINLGTLQTSDSRFVDDTTKITKVD